MNYQIQLWVNKDDKGYWTQFLESISSGDVEHYKHSLSRISKPCRIIDVTQRKIVWRNYER